MVQDLSYTYEIKNVSLGGKFMEVEYTVEGKSPMTVGVRLPFEGESLESIIKSHSPVRYFIEQSLPLANVAVGTTGSYVVAKETFESAKADKKQEIAAWRYIEETKGVYINGNLISTTRESQTSLSAAYTSMKDGFISTVNWKMNDGSFVSLDLNTITVIAQAVVNHIQSCFDREMYYLNLLEQTTTIEQVKDIIPGVTV
jgi:hypothetical protein